MKLKPGEAVIQYRTGDEIWTLKFDQVLRIMLEKQAIDVTQFSDLSPVFSETGMATVQVEGNLKRDRVRKAS